MHPGAFEFVGRFSTRESISVVEIGSRNINGTVRVHFPAASWIGLDLHKGPDVDVVVDALEYTPPSLCDLVICCEVFEHTPDWAQIVRHSAGWLKQNGKMIVTCAGTGRKPHSAIDGGKVRSGEHYANITERELFDALQLAGLTQIEVSRSNHWKDTYAIGKSCC